MSVNLYAFIASIVFIAFLTFISSLSFIYAISIGMKARSFGATDLHHLRKSQNVIMPCIQICPLYLFFFLFFVAVCCINRSVRFNRKERMQQRNWEPKLKAKAEAEAETKATVKIHKFPSMELLIENIDCHLHVWVMEYFAKCGVHICMQ